MILLVGVMSLAPTAYSYFSDVGWLTSAEVLWGALVLAFIYASYHIWEKTERLRTTDAVAVILSDARRLRVKPKWVIENYEWPPVLVEGHKPVVRPMASTLTGERGVFAELKVLRVRLQDHNELVREVVSEHNIDLILTLDPESLHQATMLSDMDDYIRRLENAATPPASLFASLSTRRLQR